MPFTRVVRVDNKKRYEHVCDHCGSIYLRNARRKNFSFCSVECANFSRKKGEKIHEKSKMTCLERHGVEYALKSEKIKKKSRQTCLDKYGVNHHTNLLCTKEKFKETCQRKYGVDHPLKSCVVKEKIKDTCLKKYGTDNPSKLEYVKEKIKRTCLKKYGVVTPLNLEEIRSNFDHKKKAQKCHLTMKRNGSYGKSKIEDEFYNFLCESYGFENVERQVRVNDWNIDFYVKSIKTFVQFDGVYWHGLNREIKLIKESNNSRDKVIYKTHLRDKEQDIWFKENGLKLIRITDKEFLKEKKNGRIHKNFQDIAELLSGI